MHIKQVLKIHSITAVIKSLIEKNNKFYLELSIIIVCTNYKTMISIKIKNPLLTYYSRYVNILDFNPERLSIEKVCAINDNLERIYDVTYSKYPFYLIIDDLKGYFKYSKEKYRKELKFIIGNQMKRKIYNQISDKIKELINNKEDVNFRFSNYFRDRNVIRFDTDDTLPLDVMVSVYSMTSIIGSVYKTCFDRFYPQIYLVYCICKKC